MQVIGADSVGVAYRQAQLAAQALLTRERPAELAEFNPGLATDLDALLAQREGRAAFNAKLAQGQLNTLALATFSALDRSRLRAIWSEDRWQVPSWQPDAGTRTLLRLYAAISLADWAAAQAEAHRLTEAPGSGLQPAARDLVLLLGLLSHAAQGDRAGAEAWHKRHAAHFIRPEWRSLAEFTLTWARHEHPCQAPG